MHEHYIFMSPAKGVGCLKTPRGFKSLLLRQTFENPCKSLKWLFTRIFLCFLYRFWVVVKMLNFYKSLYANVKCRCITLAVTHKFFLTKRWYVVYTVNADGGAVAGYFDIVKWIRLFFFQETSWVRLPLSASFLLTVSDLPRLRHGAMDEYGRVTTLSPWNVRVRSPVASPAAFQKYTHDLSVGALG